MVYYSKRRPAAAPRVKDVKKLLKILVTGGVLLGVLTLGYIWGLPAPSKPAPDANLHPEAFKRDPQLIQRVGQLGVSLDRLNLYYGPLTTHEEGQYIEPDTIIISKGLDSKTELRTLAHEYLHYVWITQASQINKSNLEVYLNNLYNKNQLLKDRMKGYDARGCEGACRVGELHSIACSEVSPTTLSKSFNDWCDYWIPGRSVLFNP